MSAHKIKTGGCYITATGVPVRILSVTNDAILLKSLQSDNQFSVPVDYPLRTLRKNELTAGRHSTNPNQDESRGASVPYKPLAPIIDAMLLKGGMTMRGIVRELRRKASASCKGKDLKANVRARLYWFKKKGHLVARNADARIKVITSK